MAHCGIQEHNEARRKERMTMKKVFCEQHGSRAREDKRQQNIRELAAAADDMDMARSQGVIYGGNPQQKSTGIVYGSNPSSVDRQRRHDVAIDQAYEYSAKIPHRYSSTNYQQQW